VLLTPVPERRPVQLFTATGPIVAHSVQIDSTTLSYVSRYRPSDCDSCRVTIPLASVDSVRTTEVSVTRTVLLLGSFVAMFIILALYTPPPT
jgi:hypothetical protein